MSGEYDLGRVQEEAGSVDPVVLWENCVRLLETSQRAIENQKVIIEAQKVRILNLDSENRGLRSRLARYAAKAEGF